MHATIEQLRHWMLVVLVLHCAALLFLDRAQLRSRLASLQANTDSVPIVWLGPGFRRSFNLSWYLWLVLGIVDAFMTHSAAHSHIPWSSWQKFVVVGYIAGMFLLILAGIWVRKRRRYPEAFLLSRGLLKDVVRKLSRKSVTLSGQEIPVYLVMSPSAAQPYARLERGVVLPFKLLDLLGRREIDSLVAQQLCLQSRQFYDPVFWTLFGCDVVAVAVVGLLHINPFMSGLLLLSLLAAELSLLVYYLPRMLLRADLRAIELAGDAETFFLATGGLSHFTGTPLREATFAEIGRAVGVSPNRVSALLAERSIPAVDRYPTSGSYLETGF